MRLFLSVLLGLVIPMTVPGATNYFRAPGTERMAQRLEQINRELNLMRNPYRSAERAERMRAALPSQRDPIQQLELRGQFAAELLQAGRSKEAIEEFEKFRKGLEQRPELWTAESKTAFRFLLALAWQRLGEQENCLLNHTSESCLMPIRGSGVHQAPAGSRGAVNVLMEHLKEFPDSLRARWLVNLAYMTLGEYPAKVPERWVIPPKVFEPDYDIKRFTDVAQPLKLDVDELAGGAVAEDFDNDGDLDLMITSFGVRDQMRVFFNNGDGTFTERTAEAGLTGLVGGLNLLQADYNNDGFNDVLVLRGAWLRSEGKYPNSLLRNNGDGTFSDVTEETGLLSFHPTQTATWLDFNGDGWIDLFIGNDPAGRTCIRANFIATTAMERSPNARRTAAWLTSRSSKA
jgi:hypothetical protein